MSACIDHGKIKSVNPKGYHIRLNPFKGRPKNAYSHRIAYCEYNNLELLTIQGKIVRHTCDNSRCINPEHLLLGTHRDNVQDRVDRKRCARQKGMEHGRAVLSDVDVKYIREHYKPYCKEFNGVILARKFGVSAGLISAVAKGNKWQHL